MLRRRATSTCSWIRSPTKEASQYKRKSCRTVELIIYILISKSIISKCKQWLQKLHKMMCERDTWVNPQIYSITKGVLMRSRIIFALYSPSIKHRTSHPGLTKPIWLGRRVGTAMRTRIIFALSSPSLKRRTSYPCWPNQSDSIHVLGMQTGT